MAEYTAGMVRERGTQDFLKGRYSRRQLHHEAHEECFIANPVRTGIRCEPVVGDA